MKIILILGIAFGGIGCWAVGANTNSVAAGQTVEASMETPASGDFYKSLPRDFEQPKDNAGRLLLREYGAVFLARGGATPPKKVVYRDESDVVAFQNTLERSTATIDGTRIELQTAAMNALNAAIAEAAQSGLTIGPRGADSARRGYNQTVSLWASRVNPGFAHWVGKRRVSPADANRIKSLTPYEQVPEILALESQGIFFAKSLDKSIIYSVAPPGTSQHLSMLALDVKEFENARVRGILAKHRWFQTVSSDLPHFTFLGVEESKLSDIGLKQVSNSGRKFWVPAI